MVGRIQASEQRCKETGGEGPCLARAPVAPSFLCAKAPGQHQGPFINGLCCSVQGQTVITGCPQGTRSALWLYLHRLLYSWPFVTPVSSVPKASVNCTVDFQLISFLSEEAMSFCCLQLRTGLSSMPSQLTSQHQELLIQLLFCPFLVVPRKGFLHGSMNMWIWFFQSLSRAHLIWFVCWSFMTCCCVFVLFRFPY